MAFLHHEATITPSKLELLAEWLPTRSWFSWSPDLHQLGAYRFDDPDDQVGLEALLLWIADDGGTMLHAPLSYRGEPLAGADDSLVGTLEHSVLGKRWVYDGCNDPVWVEQLARTLLTGGAGAELSIEVNGQRQTRPPTAIVRGSGQPGTEVPAVLSVSTEDDERSTTIHAGDLELTVVRVVGTPLPAERAAQTMQGQWSGSAGMKLLAGVSAG